MEETKPRNPNDLLIITNIDNEPHEWQFDAVRTPLPYYIGPGETRKLPYYIAKLGVEKLIDKILMKAGKIHTSSIFREQTREQIVQGIEHINLVREKTANEIALEELQRKKDADPFEELLKRREVEAEKQREATLAATTPSAPLIQHQGMAPIAPVTSPATSNILDEQISTIDVPTVALDPERQSIYNVLTSKGHMDLTHVPTREKLDSTPLTQLKDEFGSEYPEILTAPAPTAAIPTPAQTIVSDMVG